MSIKIVTCNIKNLTFKKYNIQSFIIISFNMNKTEIIYLTIFYIGICVVFHKINVTFYQDYVIA